MKNLAIIFRTAQLYAHNSHNLAYGETFFQDHKFLGKLYPVYEEAYDGIVERMIGLGQSVDLPSITQKAAAAVSKVHDEGESYDCFASLLEIEQTICKEIENTIQDCTCGTQNLLQGLADESEMRQYKLGQRLKPDTDAETE